MSTQNAKGYNYDNSKKLLFEKGEPSTVKRQTCSPLLVESRQAGLIMECACFSWSMSVYPVFELLES